MDTPRHQIVVVVGEEFMERATAATIGIKALSRDQIASAIQDELGLPAFRSRQILQWLYMKAVPTYADMTNLPVQLRNELAQKYPLFKARVLNKQISSDGTRKYLLELIDGARVETVGMPSKDRLSVCISTQAGCPLRCAFCATGQSGYVRNLGPGEIVDQAIIVAEDFGRRVSNVVLMGQGEPFLNYDASIEAMRIINSKDGLAVGARHITISTAGILPQIRRLAAEPEQFTLAVSLHSAVQETRDELMPGVKKYPLDRLHDAVSSYAQTTGRRPTYEYLMIQGVNDTDAQLKALVAFCRRTLCHVNLLPFNATPHSRFSPSSHERVEVFRKTLDAAGVEATIRSSRGADISAACGQLRQKFA